MKLGEYDQAIADYHKIKEIDPSFYFSRRKKLNIF